MFLELLGPYSIYFSDLLDRSKPYIDYLYGGTSLLLGLWLITYSCNEMQKEAFYLIVIILASAIFLQIYVTQLNFTSGLLLLPYVSWITLATLLSSYSINHQ